MEYTRALSKILQYSIYSKITVSVQQHESLNSYTSQLNAVFEACDTTALLGTSYLDIDTS